MDPNDAARLVSLLMCPAEGGIDIVQLGYHSLGVHASTIPPSRTRGTGLLNLRHSGGSYTSSGPTMLLMRSSSPGCSGMLSAWTTSWTCRVAEFSAIALRLLSRLAMPAYRRLDFLMSCTTARGAPASSTRRICRTLPLLLPLRRRQCQ